MRNASFLRGIVIIGLVLFGNTIVGLVSTQATPSDGRSLRWDRYDVTIDAINTAANTFEVTEDYTITVTTGPFSYGFAEIPTDRLDKITVKSVSQDGVALQYGCYGATGTYCVQTYKDYIDITYYFRHQMSSNSTSRIQLKYGVEGALRSYTDGDQLYWVAVPGDRAFPVLDSQVRVVMPSGVTVDKLTSYPEWDYVLQNSTIIWSAPGSLGNNGSLEVRVQYTHDPAMTKPGWQAAYDREQTYRDNFQPLVSLVLLVVSALVALVGLMWVIIRFMTHGRDPDTFVVPEYLTEPPSEELPGVVGLLLDETADMKDIMGSLIDLARRGYLVIEQTETQNLMGLFGKSEFTFHRTDKTPDDLTEYERILFRGIFRGGSSIVKMSDLRNKFYTSIPAIKNQMYAELVKRGYFDKSPEKTRNHWLFGSIASLVLASAMFWGARAVTWISPLIIVPPISIGVVGAAALLAANYMPAKTIKGAQEAARWRAFRTYLDNINRYTDLNQAAQKFDQYISYAIIFGLDKKLIKSLVPAMTSMPTWYFPTHVGGPWRGGYHRSRPFVGDSMRRGIGEGMGGLDFSGPGGLNSMSESLSDGLNAMSSGMTSMLNDASRAMTSKPSSSGSSGGGGWSGGGGGGGGGSGGGSRGFG